MPVAASVVSFVVTFIALRALLSRFAAFALDRPNERSLHKDPVPRTGGLAIVLGTGAGFSLGAGSLWLPAACALFLAAVSLIDDLRSLPTLARLAAHLLASTLVAWYLLSPMAAFELALVVLAVVWLSNLYNFMDGADGLAGGMALFGFGAYALAAWMVDHQALATFCAALAAAAAAFLIFNFHPARIFLGDVGSVPAGFLAGALGIVGWRDDAWPLWFPLLVFAPFIGDATLTLVKRLLRRERVWQAHREHYYQRMVRMGLGHRRTALVAYALMAICAGAALYGRGEVPQMQAAMFAGTAVLLAAVAVWVDLRWMRHRRTAGNSA